MQNIRTRYLTKILTIFIVALFTGLTSGSVRANGGSLNVNGRWAGIAVANASFDFNGDGVAARTFDVKTFDLSPFGGLEGAVDSALISVGRCGGASSLELKASGKFTFRGRFGDGLYAEVDPASPNLCADPVHPNETINILITGGTGIYQNATGTGTMTIHDAVRLDKLVTIPGVPFPVPAPLMIDTRGEYSLSIHL